jgi:methylmalonyl-CoA mutase cobalamin-binding subunit
VPVSRVISLSECPEDRIDFALEIAELASERVVVSKEISFDGESFVILCGPDESIARGTLEAVRSLREAGAMAIGLAADPGPFEALLRTAGVDAFVYPGADLVGALEALLDRVSHRAGDGTRGSE